MMGGAEPEPAPAPDDIIGAITLWLEENFPHSCVGRGHKPALVGISNGGEQFVIRCYADYIKFGTWKFFYEDPDMFDQFGTIIGMLLDGGFDKLDCCLAGLLTIQQTWDILENTNGSEGWITLSASIPFKPTHQPASLAFYLKYRYATNKGKKNSP